MRYTHGHPLAGDTETHMNILKALLGDHPLAKKIQEHQERVEARLTPLTGVIAPLERPVVTPARPKTAQVKARSLAGSQPVEPALPVPEVKSGSLVSMLKTAQAEALAEAQATLAEEQQAAAEEQRAAEQALQEQRQGGVRRTTARISLNIQAVPAVNTARVADWNSETLGDGVNFRMKIWWGNDTSTTAPEATPLIAAQPDTAAQTPTAQPSAAPTAPQVAQPAVAPPAPVQDTPAAEYTPESFLDLLESLSTPEQSDTERLRQSMQVQGMARIQQAKRLASEKVHQREVKETTPKDLN